MDPAQAEASSVESCGGDQNVGSMQAKSWVKKILENYHLKNRRLHINVHLPENGGTKASIHADRMSLASLTTYVSLTHFSPRDPSPTGPSPNAFSPTGFSPTDVSLTDFSTTIFHSQSCHSQTFHIQTRCTHMPFTHRVFRHRPITHIFFTRGLFTQRRFAYRLFTPYICLARYLSICLACPSIFWSPCLSICCSVYLSICLAISIYLFGFHGRTFPLYPWPEWYLSIYLSVCLSVYLSVCLSVYLSIYRTF